MRFWKLHRAKTSTVEQLAGWKWLPPKIQPGKNKKYDQKIDIWLLAYTRLYSLGFQLIGPVEKAFV